MQRLEKAQRRDLDANHAAGGENGRAVGDADLPAVDGETNLARRHAAIHVGGARGALQLDELRDRRHADAP